MPGIDTGAPERTLTKSGRAASPNVVPVAAPTAATAARSSSARPAGSAPCSSRWRHTSVVSVKPGGTGMPSRAISTRPAPLPPSSAAAAL